MQATDDTWKSEMRTGLPGEKFFLFLIKLLGIRAAYIFLGFVVAFFVPFAPKATRACWRYARHILHYNPLHAFFFLFLSYYRFGQTLIDKKAIGSGLTEDYSFHFDDTLSRLLQAPDGRQDAILLGAHVGNWEIGTPFFREYGKKEYVCLQGDRFTEGAKTLRTRFMGKEADFPAEPFIFASRMKGPVFFYFAMRERRRNYRFIFLPAGTGSETHYLSEYVSALESLLAKYPSQWFNYYDFWK